VGLDAMEGEYRMISVTNLQKTYKGDVRALRGVTLEIGNGMFGLIGPNGAGKTTLMRILTGLLRPTAGDVCVLGHDMTDPHSKMAVKSMLGYLPQELGLYPSLTAREFLDYVAILKGVTDRRARRQQVTELLELVGLADAADRRLKAYSGGMKRRVGIAQALLGNPELLIVDEPTAGLDPEERVRLRNLLADMAGRRTIILSTHIVEDVSQTCTKLAVLHEGQILFHDTPGGLVERARGHVWTITLLPDERPADALTVVSTLRLDDRVEYRVVGDEAGHPAAQPVTPNLEDGYLWLMRQSAS
jgi:ABC-2 type transport system ATP-binding protein